MKFPRNVRIFRGHLDVAPFAGVFFLLIIFLLLATLVYTPGFAIRLPEAPAVELSGVSGPTMEVAVDATGQLYFENQPVQREDLRRRLIKAAKLSREPLTLVIAADKAVTHEMEIQLAGLARDPKVNVRQVVWKTLPRIFDEPAREQRPP
jgi:biopolymer transport protein ExbD